MQLYELPPAPPPKGEFDEFLEHKAKEIQNMTAYSDALDAEIRRLKYLKELNEDEIKEARFTMAQLMLEMGVVKTQAGIFKLSLCKNGGATPMWINSELRVEDVPQRFIKMKPEIDRDAIRLHLEAGLSLPFANLLERGYHVRIS